MLAVARMCAFSSRGDELVRVSACLIDVDACRGMLKASRRIAYQFETRRADQRLSAEALIVMHKSYSLVTQALTRTSSSL